MQCYDKIDGIFEGLQKKKTEQNKKHIQRLSRQWEQMKGKLQVQ